MQPLRGVEPQVGTKVAFDVNDAGRVALGGTIGPEIAQVEGQLLEKDGQSFLLAMAVTRMLRGGEQVWSGEQVRVRSDYVMTSYERRFSMSRSIALGLISVGGFGAFLVTRELLANGPGGGGTPCTTDCGTGNERIARLGRP
jgi:hypothetical protein